MEDNLYEIMGVHHKGCQAQTEDNLYDPPLNKNPAEAGFNQAKCLIYQAAPELPKMPKLSDAPNE